MPSMKRLSVLLAAGLVAIPLTAVAISYACTGLATIATSASAVTAGSNVVVTGRGFSPHDAADARTESVKLRFDSASGPVLAEASPSSTKDGGKFTVTIAVPGVTPGAHVLLATQNGPDGRPAYGTPARTGLEVMAPPSPPPPPPSASAPVPASASASPSLELPALSQLLAADSMTLIKAVLKCKQRHRPASAKTVAGRKRVAKRRATCVRQAKKRYP